MSSEEAVRGRPVKKAFELVELLSSSGAMTLAELARASGLPKSSLHRMMDALTGSSLVRRTSSGYEIGDCLFDLIDDSARARVDRVLKSTLAPHIIDLRERTGGVVSTGILAGSHVRQVDVQYDLRHLCLVQRVPTMLPAHCTAIGRALRSRDPDAVVVANGELYSGVIGVAASLVAGDHLPRMAISVWGPAETINVDFTTALLKYAVRAMRSDLLRCARPSAAVLDDLKQAN
ncbi:helix-turn-helix domain-containing protein [Lentzea sp. NPDC042327]|uniref:helix-turn-helix domain-containing protein n=1 Tax=Lentzea sp. NPDC042327 TaxID=3154801 RepID=UPI0033FD0117